jgi:hypothetical protein
MLPGRDSKIHVFRLSDFDRDFSAESSARGRQDLKEHRLERTRGCHMYAISRPGGSHLRMVSRSLAHQCSCSRLICFYMYTNSCSSGVHVISMGILCILCTSLTLIFIYFRYRYSVTKLITHNTRSQTLFFLVCY